MPCVPNPSAPHWSPPYLSLTPPNFHFFIFAFRGTRIFWLFPYPQPLNAVVANSFLNKVHRTHLNIFLSKIQMSLLYRGPSGLLSLAGYVAINSFFRVHESVANKEKKKKRKVSSKTLLSSPALFLSRRALCHHQNGPCEHKNRKDT